MQNYSGSTMPRNFVVEVMPTSGTTNLFRTNVLTAAAGTRVLDSGVMSGEVDLTAFVNQNVRIQFAIEVPENFTGPGFLQLDNVAMVTANHPPVIQSQPVSQSVALGGNALFSVLATGAAPLTYQWTKNGLSIPGANSATLSITNVQAADAGDYVVSVGNSFGVTISQTATLSVGGLLRQVTLGHATGMVGSTVTVPVTLNSQGNENALGFSVRIPTNSVRFLRAVPSTNGPSLALILNTNSVSSGFVGMIMFRPSGSSFAAGTIELLNLEFLVLSRATLGSNAVTFADFPATREVSDPSAAPLSVRYVDGSVTISGGTIGLAADVTPRPNGDGSVTTTDWVQVGRFVAGLDNPATVSEFRRADVAPTASNGDGVITSTDWVQAGRYALGIDSPPAAGGPSGPFGAVAVSALVSSQVYPPVIDKGPAVLTGGQREFRFRSIDLVPGQIKTLTIEMAALGNEASFGFSVGFDTNHLEFLSLQAGSGLPAGMLFNASTNRAANGVLGIAAGLFSGVMSTGTHEVVTLSLLVKPTASSQTKLSFTDSPVIREVSDAAANVLNTQFRDRVFVVVGGTTLPVIIEHPLSQNALAGTNVLLSVSASGTAPLSYQWFWRNNLFSGATGTSLALPNVRRFNTGPYFVVVSNSVGAVTSRVAVLRVRSRQMVRPPRRLPGGRIRFEFGDADGGLLNSGDIGQIVVQATRRLAGTNTVWTDITSGFVLTNGVIQFDDNSAVDFQWRFYRIVER